MNASEKRIGLLGGSFDPVHNGHLSIVESFLKSVYIDELWILLTPDPPHKTDVAQADYEYRMEMLKTAFCSFKNVIISDLEKNLPKPSYTLQTLEYLSHEYPDSNFHLCIGGDLLDDFKKWKDWDKIIEYCEILVAHRPGIKAVIPDERLSGKVHFIDHEPVEISSTEVRKRIAENDDISELVPNRVKHIIEKYNLYENP